MVSFGRVEKATEVLLVEPCDKTFKGKQNTALLIKPRLQEEQQFPLWPISSVRHTSKTYHATAAVVMGEMLS